MFTNGLTEDMLVATRANVAYAVRMVAKRLAEGNERSATDWSEMVIRYQTVAAYLSDRIARNDD